METPADIVNEFYETCNSKQGQGMDAFVADDIWSFLSPIGSKL